MELKDSDMNRISKKVGNPVKDKADVKKMEVAVEDGK